jgi:ADP-dependent phosphofructokinase/glucokinase
MSVKEEVIKMIEALPEAIITVSDIMAGVIFQAKR